MSPTPTQTPTRSADVIILDAQTANPAQAPAPTPKPEQTTTQPSRPGYDPREIPQTYMEMGREILTLLGFCIATYAVYRFFSLRSLRTDRAPTLAPGLDERLARIEQAVDAMSIEVERISEGQRFTTKLLSERAGDAAALPGRESR